VGNAADFAPVTVWEQYEQRKQSLRQQGLTQYEYEQAVRRLADELGV